MASISNDPGGRRRIQFLDENDDRQTISLGGKVTKRQAEVIQRHVEHLLAAKVSGEPLSRETAGWLAEIGEDLRDKLRRVGLVEQPKAAPVATVGQLVEEFLTVRTDVKPGTRTNLILASRNLLAFVGEDRLITAVTEADADNFLRGMLADGLAQNTARRRAGRAKQFFAYAVKKRLIPTNPFAAVKVSTGGNRERQEYVPVETIEKVLAACPSAEWRLIVALCRFAGLRCPSEHLALTWDDVLWDQMRFVVHAPKTEHIEGKESRVVPIFPELYPYLREAFEEAPDGESRVILRNRCDGGQGTAVTTNWSTQFARIIKRAGVTKRWPRLFHALRASAQTDLCNKFPTHVVCSWLGNSIAVAREHYLSVTEDHFREAAARTVAKFSHEPLPTGHNEAQREEPRSPETLGFVGNEALSADSGSERMTPRGSEQRVPSLQNINFPETVLAESLAVARILTLIDQLTPEDRAVLLARLAPARLE